MEKISAVYKIVNTVTGDSYIGSSKNVMHRWEVHKCISTWKRHPNNKMYQDMNKFGVDKFSFQILAPIIPECLKKVEQRLIEMLKPTYNDRRANGLDVERKKTTDKVYRKSEKHKQSLRKARKKYSNKLCSYNGEIITLNALRIRFIRAGIPNPTAEAKKYIFGGNNDDDKIQ